MGIASNPSSNALDSFWSSFNVESPLFLYSAYFLLTSLIEVLNIPRKRTSGNVRNDRSMVPLDWDVWMIGMGFSESCTSRVWFLLQDHPTLQFRSSRAPSQRERD